MIFKNGQVFLPDGYFKKMDLQIDASHKIAESIDITDKEIIDATDCYLVPGFVDIHIHGAKGSDFCDADESGLKKIATYLRSRGITSFCPTSMTLPLSRLETIFKTVSTHVPSAIQADIAGIHMEGPYISPEKKGAQKEFYLTPPTVNDFLKLNSACGNKIRLVTLAPELPGSLEFIDRFSNEITISLGHSACDYKTATEAFQHGANHVTHIFDAMNAFHHREPGIVGAAADACMKKDHFYVEVICDGIHIHPSMVRSIFQLFGPDHVVLISDAMRACGMKDGTYELGGQQVQKCGPNAILADGTLAGSVTDLFSCFQNAVAYGIPLESALKAVTINPARSIGAESKIGQLLPGRKADLLLLDKNQNLLGVY